MKCPALGCFGGKTYPGGDGSAMTGTCSVCKGAGSIPDVTSAMIPSYLELKAEITALLEAGVPKAVLKAAINVYAAGLSSLPSDKFGLLQTDLRKLQPERVISKPAVLGLGYQGSSSNTGYSINYTEAGDTMFSRQGYWGSTFTGKRIYLDEPRAEDFCIMDIAHGLSNVCRYGGQCISFYSVAEHSYRGAKNIERFAKMDDGVASLTALRDAYEFLLHDAAEAYVGDQIRPVVMYLDSYREMRDKMQAVINRKFNLPATMTKVCKEMDERMLSTESRIMFGHDDKWWESPEFAEPIRDEWIKTRDQTIVDREDGREPPMVERPIGASFMPPSQVKRLFLEYFYQLHETLVFNDMVPELPL